MLIYVYLTYFVKGNYTMSNEKRENANNKNWDSVKM